MAITDSVATLKQKNSRDQGIIDSENATVQELCNQIGRLQCAYNLMQAYATEVVDTYSDHTLWDPYIEDTRWVGNTQLEFADSIYQNFGDSIGKLGNDIINYRDAITIKIGELQGQIDDLNWDISLRESAISIRKKEIRAKEFFS